MITDQDVDDALTLLLETEDKYAKAKADVIYAGEMRKVIKAMAMIAAEKKGHKTMAAQEREAYASREYRTHLDEIFNITLTMETTKAQRDRAHMTIEMWKTQSFNERQRL